MSASTSDCPHCGAAGGPPFFVLRGVPVFCNVLWDSAEAARRAPAGDIELSRCPGCGLIFNRAFDPRLVEYAPGYQNPLHFSPRFRAFADELCRRLIEEHRLQGGLAVEIGCGDADFLCRLTANGLGRGIGFDPSLPADAQLAGQRVEIHAERFGARPLPAGADLLVCRHVLEHIPRPGEWLRGIKRGLGGQQTMFYCEVPNARWLLEACSLWDVIYEHVTYWTPASIVRLFGGAGFVVRSVSTGFDEQFLMIEAANGAGEDAAGWRVPATAPDEATLCGRFGRSAQARSAEWRGCLAEAGAAGRTAVAWGAGSKGVMFAHLAGGDTLAGVVDINPGKQGRFIPGTAVPVLAPEDLSSLRPDLVFVMNANYLEEIEGSLAANGLAPRLVEVMDVLGE
jgi:hypothetical protein